MLFQLLTEVLLLLDKISGKVRFTINNQNGLPDDEIFAIGSDKSGGLWLSHQYGLTRADLNLPVGNFSIYPGLKGNLTTSLRHNNELYVATSEGVFYLTEVKNYSEVEILIKNKPESYSSQPDIQSEKIQEAKNSRKNIFTRIFGRKITKDKKDSASASTVNATDSVNPYGASTGQYTWKTINKIEIS